MDWGGPTGVLERMWHSVRWTHQTTHSLHQVLKGHEMAGERSSSGQPATLLVHLRHPAPHHPGRRHRPHPQSGRRRWDTAGPGASLAVVSPVPP